MKIELNDDTKWILGLPNFKCSGMARTLRLNGHEIPEKAEEEQAYVIHWLLNLYLKNPKKWRTKAAEEFSK